MLYHCIIKVYSDEAKIAYFLLPFYFLARKFEQGQWEIYSF